MAGIIKTSINLSAIPKDKIITGKKGKYLPISITVIDQTKDEREAKQPKTYLGNCRVVWTNGTFPEPIKTQGVTESAPQPVADKHDDIPF